jgi:D-arabinose 1-dehydrogenase-like Zn-dependent alcohol dehydrogenase
MRALQLAAWKSQPELREVRDPEPGPGQVVVRIAAAGACHSDLHAASWKGARSSCPSGGSRQFRGWTAESDSSPAH